LDVVIRISFLTQLLGFDRLAETAIYRVPLYKSKRQQRHPTCVFLNSHRVIECWPLTNYAAPCCLVVRGRNGENPDPKWNDSKFAVFSQKPR